jgi:nucleoside-diphosphate-sugar epimerase
LRAAARINLLSARLLGYAPMLTPGKVRELTHTGWTCDNGRIQETIDWAPRIDLAEGIRRTLA